MNEDIIKSLEPILEGPICHEQLKDARALSCGHSFCRECLDRYVSTKVNDVREAGAVRERNNYILIECPCCRRKVWVKRQIKEATTALLVNNIIEVINNVNTNQSKMCDSHPGNEKKYACERCRVCICSECLLNDHFDHGPKPKTVQDIIQIMRKFLSETDDTDIRRSEFVSNVEFLQKRGIDILDKLEKDIFTHYELCLSKLTESKNLMLSFTEKQKHILSQKVQELVPEHQELVSRISHIRSRASGALRRGRPADILDVHISFAEQIKKDLNEPLPSTEEIEGEINFLKTLYFDEPKSSEIKDCLGRISN